MWRLIPFAMVLYILNYLDRVNVSFAKLEMNKELGFGDSVYGFGASIFFIGYFLFELPSNLVMQRVGARLWITRIMVTWGIISACMAFVKGSTSFYVLRFLLGVAEAGFFPAIIYYLSNWVPATHRTRVTAWFLTSIAVAGMLGGPIAGALLSFGGWGLSGWQWLFLLEGIPTVFLGFVVLVCLPDSPKKAPWLDEDERHALVHALDAEHANQASNAHLLRVGMTNPAVWFLAFLYGLVLFGFYGLSYWTPSMIKQVSHGSNLTIGWLSSVPFAAAVIGMIVIGHVADRVRGRLVTAGLSLLVGAVGMFLCAFCSSAWGVVLSLSVAAVGVYGALAPFWTVLPAMLRGSAAAAGIAIVNSLGNLGGGLIGPNVIAQLRERYTSYGPGLLVTAAVLFLAAVMAVAMASWLNRKRSEDGVTRY